MAYPSFLAERRKLMAQVVRDAYSRLTEHGYTPAYPPADLGQAGDQPGGTRTRYSVTVTDLITAELLPIGTTLRPVQRNLEVQATVLPEGKIAYADEIYTTPSGASDAAGNASTNGWTFWLADTPDGLFTLAALRDQFLAHQG
jgi:ABC-type transport system substrate-binding protein